MNKYPYAERPECEQCVSNIGGSCIALVDTRSEHKCAFMTDRYQLKADQDLLQKRIKEGQIPQQILIKYGIVKG